MLVAGKTTGINTVGGLIAAAKAKPGVLKFGSTGRGTGTHVGVEQFNQAARIKALHVPPSPNDSNADTVGNAIAGRFDYYLVPVSLVLPHLRDGTLVALGVSTARRSTLIPEVTTIAEAIAGFDFPIWWAPAGTPKGVVHKLAKDIRRVLAGPDLREWIAKHGGRANENDAARVCAFRGEREPRCGATFRAAGLAMVLREHRSG